MSKRTFSKTTTTFHWQDVDESNPIEVTHEDEYEVDERGLCYVDFISSWYSEGNGWVLPDGCVEIECVSRASDYAAEDWEHLSRDESPMRLYFLPEREALVWNAASIDAVTFEASEAFASFAEAM